MTIMPLDEKEIARALRKIYESRFYGKINYRFRISKSRLAKLAGQDELKRKFVEGIRRHLTDNNLVLVDIGADFAVLEKDRMHRFRQVPDDQYKEFVRQLRKDKKELATSKKKRNNVEK